MMHAQVHLKDQSQAKKHFLCLDFAIRSALSPAHDSEGESWMQVQRAPSAITEVAAGHAAQHSECHPFIRVEEQH